MDMFWQNYVLLIYILYIFDVFVNVLYCHGGLLSLPFLVGFDTISLRWT